MTIDAPDPPRSGQPLAPEQGSATRTLIAIVVFAVLLTGVSDALLVRSSAFWRYALKNAPIADRLNGYWMEAVLRLAQPGSVEVLVLGNSLAHTNVDLGALADGLNLRQKQVIKVVLPGASVVEVAMLAPLVQTLRPRLVVVPASVLALRPFSAPDKWQYYSAAVATDLFRVSDLLREHDDHAAGLLTEAHTIIRHREGLRRLLFPGAFVEERQSRRGAGRAQANANEIKRLRLQELSCDSANVRAFGVLADWVHAGGGRLVVAASPSRFDRGRRPMLRQLSMCLSPRAQTAGYEYIGGEGLEMQFDHFKDPIHFNRGGRRVFTDHLLSTLQQLQGSPTARF